MTDADQLETREDSADKQHLSKMDMDKLRTAIKTQVSGEWMIKLSDLERILRLAGQNMSTSTVEEIRTKLEDIHQTDEVFLDEIEPILAMYWEELTDEEISNMLLESFEVFDTEQQGLIDRRDLIEHLTKLGDMPLNGKDLSIMFSLVDKVKTSPTAFDYRLFVKRLCGLKQPAKKTKRRKRRR